MTWSTWRRRKTGSPMPATFMAANGCDATIARELGADQALTGLVQKVSNLILNINLYLRDSATGDLLNVMSADVRGNTDESWSRGVSWLAAQTGF